MATTKKGTKKATKRSTKKTTKTTTKAAGKRPRKAAGSKAREPKTPPQPPTAPQTLRGQGLRAAAGYPEDFHALYDRGFRAARGLDVPSKPAVSPALRQM